MDDRLRNDLLLSHALINTLSAASQGAHAFERSLGQFGVGGADDRAEQAAEQIRLVDVWWSGFKRREPLCQAGEAESQAARHAWSMLRDAGQRLGALLLELRRPFNLEALVVDPGPLRLRAVVACELAYAREYLVRGLVWRDEVMGESEIAEHHRRRLPGCQHGVREAHRILASASRWLDASPPPVLEITELLDATLTAPAEVAVRALELRCVASLATGRFDFAAAAIGNHDQWRWEQLGLTPVQAGRWVAAGFAASEAAEWTRAGVLGPVSAAGFHLRGIDSTTAGPWFAAEFDGREAIAWMDAGVDVAEATSFKSRGARLPERRARVA